MKQKCFDIGDIIYYMEPTRILDRLLMCQLRRAVRKGQQKFSWSVLFLSSRSTYYELHN